MDINILIDDLPTEYNGYLINYTFRSGILISECLNDKSIKNDMEKIYSAFRILFGRGIPPFDEALEGLKWFLSGGKGNNTNDGGDKLARCSDGSNVAVTHGCDGDNGPVDATRNAGDGGVGGALNAVHGGAENHGNDEDEHHKDKHLHGTASERVQQEPRLAEEPLHLEYAEDAEHTHQTEYGEGAGGGYQQAEPGGEYREEVDDAIEGEHVFPRFVEAVDAQIVLEGKEDGEEPADGTHGPGEPGGGARHALHHDGDDVDADEDQQPDVELFACRGVGFEDDGVDLLFGQRSVAFGK